MNCCIPKPKHKHKSKPIRTGCGSATDMANHLNMLGTEPTEVIKENGKTVQVYHF